MKGVMVTQAFEQVADYRDSFHNTNHKDVYIIAG